MDKDLENLKNRILKIRKTLSPMEARDMTDAEKVLGITLSNEFKILNMLHGYDCFGLFAFYNWHQSKEYNVITRTLWHREKLNLPHEFLVLAEGDVTSVLMQTQSLQDPSPVIFCLLEKVDDLCKTHIIPSNTEMFHTFADFYEYLLEQEEKATS